MNLVFSGKTCKSQNELFASKKRLTVPDIACRCNITTRVILNTWDRVSMGLKPKGKNKQRYLIAVESKVARYIYEKKKKYWSSFSKDSEEETQNKLLEKIKNTPVNIFTADSG